MTKKSKLYLMLAAVLVVFSACENEDEPVKVVQYRASRIEEIAYKRKLIYNGSGQLIKVVSESTLPDKEILPTTHEYEYDLSGKIFRTVMDNEAEFFYTWENDRIVQTEERVNGIPFQRYTFLYQASGLVKEMLIYRYEQPGILLNGKISYAFDADQNISAVRNFSFKENIGFELETIYEYDRYDRHESVDSQFDIQTLNSSFQLHKNNPGRMVSKNRNGVAYSIEDYVYEYTSNGLPLKRESTITFLHIGSTGSYVTNYFFEPI